MFLRFNRRVKDGKEHRYWNIVENRRCASGKVVQRQVLYLGEINDSQHEAWCRVIDAFDEVAQRHTQLALFPADRAVPQHAQGHGVQVRLDAMELHRPRQWGACWLACQLYEQLELDRFWAARLPDSREGTCWQHILANVQDWCGSASQPGAPAMNVARQIQERDAGRSIRARAAPKQGRYRNALNTISHRFPHRRRIHHGYGTCNCRCPRARARTR